MKTRKVLAVACAMAMIVASFAQATPLYWDDNGTTAGAGATPTGIWGTDGNWNTDSTGANLGALQVGTLNTDDLFFVAAPGAASGNNAYVVTVNGAQVGKSITFQASGGTTISGGTSITLGDGTPATGGITMNQLAYGAVAQGAATISTALILNNSQTWTNNSTQNLSWSALNLGSGTLTFAGSGNFSSTAGSIAATAGSIIHNGSGIVYLPRTGTLAYTGTTTISGGGTLQIDDVKPTGNFNLTNGMLTDYYQTTQAFTSGLGTNNNQIQIYGNSGFGAGNGSSTWRIGASGSNLVWGASGEGGATGYFNPTTLKLRASQGDNNGPSIWGYVVLDNWLDLNSGTRTIDVYQGGGSVMNSRATINGGIKDTGAAGNLIKNGGGVLFIGGTTSTWGGTTTINGGLVDFQGNSIASIGGGAGRNITIVAGAGIKFNALSNTILNRIAQTNAQIVLMTGTTANNLDFSSTGANLPNAFLGNWASNGAKCEYYGTITPGSHNYCLGSSWSSGLLGMRNESVMSGTQGLIVGGGSVELVGPKTFTGDTVITNGARLGLAAIAGGNNTAYGLQNSVLDVGTPSNTGTIWFESCPAGFITGAIATSNAVLGGLKGSRNLYSVYSTTTGANNSGATPYTSVIGFTLNGASGKTNTYSGAIGGFGAGASGSTGGAMTLTKKGAGTQIISGTNTYTGATLVLEGVLDVRVASSLGSCAAIQIAYDVATLRLENADNGGSPWNLAALTALNATLIAGTEGPAYELKFTANGDYTDITAQFIPAGTFIQLK